MESMTNAPHLLPGRAHGLQVRRRRDARRHGLRRADRRLRPHRRWASRPSGTTPRLGITREEQDAFAARSHQRAAAAQKNGAVRRRDRAGGDPAAQGRPDRVHARTRASAPDTTAEALAKLRPAFAQGRHDHRRHRPRRSPTAPAAVVVMSKAKAEELGPDLARRDRRARQRRRPGQLAAVASRPTRSSTRCGKAGLDRRPTST